MKTLRRMIYRETVGAITFVALAFLALFFLFDMLDELRYVGSVPGYTLGYGTLTVLLGMPSHLYELLPIAVLIGAIFVMARFAQSSEFTIMRTSGLGPWLALRTMLTLGLGFVLLTALVGDYLAPLAEHLRIQARGQYLGQVRTVGSTGAWLRERTPDGLHTLAINVGAVPAGGDVQRVRIFRFDGQGRVVQQLHAATAHIAPRGAAATAGTQSGQWVLHSVREITLDYPLQVGTGVTLAQDAAPVLAKVQRQQHDSLAWPSAITRDMLLAATHKAERMPTLELLQFVNHLRDSGQSAQKYEIELWRKVFYPLSCLVMVVLALPFAYLHFRSGGIATYVFGGVMAGISFFLLNNVFGYAGNLQNWSPMLAAAAPGLIYSLLSLCAFAWMVLRQ